MKQTLFFIIVLFLVNRSYTQSLKTGEQAPEIAFAKTVSKEKFDRHEKFLVLDFWATWCAPCIASFPDLRKLAAKFKSKNVVFATISYEEPEKIENFFAKRTIYQLDFHKLADIPDTAQSMYFKGKTFKNFKVHSIPQTFIIDPVGKILWIGSSNNLTEEILENILRGKPSTESQETAASTFKNTNVFDSVQVGSFKVKMRFTEKEYNGSFMGGRGMVVFPGEKVNILLARLRNWHSIQIDTTAMDKLPAVELSVKGNPAAPRDSLFIAASLGIEKLLQLKINVTDKFYEVFTVTLNEPAKLLKNAAAFDEKSNKSSAMLGKTFYTAINCPWTRIVESVLNGIEMDKIFVLGEENTDSVKDRKFDFTIPNGDFDALKKFFEKEYGIVIKPEQRRLPTIVLQK